ncbi:glutathione-dependent formaldehyde-activating enzyme [Colletotrichum graminicola M1.001]|uniref:Glutathione-dependent formaldehyde-activating enzyme n=1 Tax=Colletotrichum graminicola (strain M1.001 / M2 / FGSC 10212) TaxID=645133 RepID=E3QM68_COLGM|nr:glutathione-dependent formaldehyde-activating enzyme [Colletotrichum graminicola M1.001]EFQ31956.1 glutathione-dependent formaldehyde-activating enzyme [Colletotrichum graminicola M1.001]
MLYPRIVTSNALSSIIITTSSSSSINEEAAFAAQKYTIEGGYGFTVLCHCNSCRKFTGSSFGANSLVDRKTMAHANLSVGQNLTVQDPGSHVSVYKSETADSGGTLARSFCRLCGSSLFVATHETSDKVAVTSGTMNDVQGVEGDNVWTPKLEFFCKRKATWLATEGTVQKDAM